MLFERPESRQFLRVAVTKPVKVAKPVSPKFRRAATATFAVFSTFRPPVSKNVSAPAQVTDARSFTLDA